MKDDLIKIFAERLLGITEKGKSYEETFRQYCEVLSDFRDKIKEEPQTRIIPTKRIDQDYPIREIVERSGSLERGFPIKLIDSNEERYNNEQAIEEL